MSRRIGRQEILQTEPLSKALQLATGLNLDAPFQQWLRLELGGYYSSNSAMTPDVFVPEYRAVAGAHYDWMGRRLVVQADLAFINEIRLRNGVEELEGLLDGRETVVSHDPGMCEMLRDKLGVAVDTFRFSAVHVKGILASIRNEFSIKLNGSEVTEAPMVEEEADIIQLKPSIYGFGIDLRALWRKLWGSKR